MSSSTFSVCGEEVLAVLLSLDVNKASGPDGISNRMLKETARSISSSLTDIFNFSLRVGVYPSQWKEANITPVHKSGPRKKIENYRPISLLCVISKVMERLVYNKLYLYLVSNNLLTSKNAGFKKNNSTITQLVALCHKIYLGLEEHKCVSMVFLDASKAFDKVWHVGLIYKLKQLGIVDDLLTWFQSYLSNRRQRVVVEGETSTWSKVETGVPQGSILGPLLFLIYTNDIVQNIHNDIYLYADDTSLLSISSDIELAAKDINADLCNLQQWANLWHMTFNPHKTVFLQISNYKTIFLNGIHIQTKKDHTHLGITLSRNMQWTSHIDRILERVNQRLGVLQCLKFSLSRDCLSHLYKTMILPIMDYGDVIYDNCNEKNSHSLELVHNKAARMVSGAFFTTNVSRLLNEELGWESLKSRRHRHKIYLFHRIIHGNVPSYLSDILSSSQLGVTRQTRRQNNIRPFLCKTRAYQDSFFPSTAILWNALPEYLKRENSPCVFKKGHMLSVLPPSPPPYFGQGERWLSIIHTQLRLGHSPLNSHLFRIGIIDTASCSCGFHQENVVHFFLQCPLYKDARNKLLHSLCEIAHIDETMVKNRPKAVIEVILNGSDRLPVASNKRLFCDVCRFISATGRFMFYTD